MHPSPLLCILVALWSVLGFCNSIFPILLGFILMECAWSLKILTQMGDFGCGFFVFGCSNALLLLFVAFGLGLRVLQFGGFNRFCSKRVFKESRKISKPNGDHCVEERDDFLGANEELEEEQEEGENEVCVEDEVFSVIELREMVKDQKRIVNAAQRDLEKERMAAASAAEEAMAMILRLQNEKSSLQIEANQLQRLGEDKQAYDDEVIQSLQRIVMQYEDERSLLEQQLKLCKKRLRMHLQDDEIELLDCMTSPCSWSLSRSRMAGCRFEDFLVGALD